MYIDSRFAVYCLPYLLCSALVGRRPSITATFLPVLHTSVFQADEVNQYPHRKIGPRITPSTSSPESHVSACTDNDPPNCGLIRQLFVIIRALFLPNDLKQVTKDLVQQFDGE